LRSPFFFLLVDSLLELLDWEDAAASLDVFAACVVVLVSAALAPSVVCAGASPAETGCVPADPAAG
jgi:hypothetical protein